MYKVLEEKEDFIIISKSDGVEFHGEDQLVSSLRLDFKEIYGVHRLDKATSGVMVFAKSKTAQSALSKLFSERKVSKKYFALSNSKPSKKQGIIKGDIEKSRNGSYKMSRSLVNPSITRFTSNYCESCKVRVFNLLPKTGRTHQLRVVMRSLGAPIIGDSRYGGECSDRMYLHAYYLGFTYKGETFEFRDMECTGNLMNDELRGEILKYIKEE
jgi:tRNA pseudouridine32 synthase/23S rRNA pseudouridine746 synthase